MKKLLSIIILGLFFIVVGCEKDSLFDLQDQNTQTQLSVRELSPEVDAIVEGGVKWLLDRQNAAGYFENPSYQGIGEERVARTGMAIVKLCDRSIELGHADPLAEDAPYNQEILAGLEYIISQQQVYGDGKSYTDYSRHANYATSWALMAFAATRDYDTYGSHAQAAAKYFTSNQAANGGWGYYAEPGELSNENVQDNSNTGYVVLALVAAQNFGCDIGGVVGLHETWVDIIQDDATGGSKYRPLNWDWINMLKTGNLLFEMAFVADKVGDTNVDNAVGYLEANWSLSNNDPGFQGDPPNYQAMYTMMKGFTALGIKEINVGGPIDWYDEFVDLIDGTKETDDGKFYWKASTFSDDYISTIFALLTLEKIVELPRIEVNLDIKPTSCPNPFNMNANGVLPVAILGSPDCDVTQIDINSLTLVGVPPIRNNYEDVSAPVVDPTDECECTTAGPDGFMDLTLKFYRQDIATALGEVNDGDVVPLTINGFLVNGLELSGTDCIWIKKKGKKPKNSKGK